jgi:glycosyltransferase involved in cell wall biosynthesis
MPQTTPSTTIEICDLPESGSKTAPKTTPKPIVSVIVPTYNIEAYLADTLRSLEAQTLENFEVLIVDDGSTDSSAAIAQAFCNRDQRFKLLQKPNGGLSSARNHGIRHAKSDFIALLDGDDLYHPEKLMTHIIALESDPQIGVVYSASEIIREDGSVTAISLSGKPILPDILPALLCKNFVGHGSNGIFRRVLWELVGGFDEELRSFEDVDFWLRIAAARSTYFFREPRKLCQYRVRPQALSTQIPQMQHYGDRVMLKAVNQSPDRLNPILPQAQAYLYRYLARLALTSGDLPLANQLIDRAWNYNWRIFYQDLRSLFTLIAIKLAPLSKFSIHHTLKPAVSHK